MPASVFLRAGCATARVTAGMTATRKTVVSTHGVTAAIPVGVPDEIHVTVASCFFSYVLAGLSQTALN